MTHDELCERAARWLRNTKRCRIVLREVVSCAGEEPDAIGWLGTGQSILVECKVSRSDFRADQKKHVRAWGGIGAFRFYLTPGELVRADELPEGWGLLEVRGRSVHMVHDATQRELTPGQYISELVHMMRGIRLHNGVDKRPTKGEAYVSTGSSPGSQECDVMAVDSMPE